MARISPSLLLPSHSSSARLALLCLCVALAGVTTTAEDQPEPGRSRQHLQNVADDLRARLLISAPVVVVTVPHNSLMLSVTPPPVEGDAFKLDVDAAFLETLTARELEAAIAHELGHVWIFTHHPFLQTEQLANDVAMRVVDRAMLARVYDKVWRREGLSGPDMTRYLGPDPSSEKTRAAHVP